ncbi:hypothetical protein SAMN05192552_101225 [Natrinema hispanicum]|uniref:Uncharacterized protein n=1 Tax=Natrinema hispanicum TaxID=392421 RepID=A0A1G6RVH9_9EURY|nr:hypothetical protein SAMN05192552_101225 [Natrinema hispanicum]
MNFTAYVPSTVPNAIWTTFANQFISVFIKEATMVAPKTIVDMLIYCAIVQTIIGNARVIELK